MRTAATFPARPESVRRARDLVTVAMLDGACTPPTIETARLLVSELATNAVVHARSEEFTVEADVEEPVVRVTVSDGDTRLPVSHDPGDSDLGGRGIWLVDSLACRWASERRDVPAGKRVWFELGCA